MGLSLSKEEPATAREPEHAVVRPNDGPNNGGTEISEPAVPHQPEPAAEHPNDGGTGVTLSFVPRSSLPPGQHVQVFRKTSGFAHVLFPPSAEAKIRQVARVGKFASSSHGHLLFGEEFVFKVEVSSLHNDMAGTFFFQPKVEEEARKFKLELGVLKFSPTRKPEDLKEYFVLVDTPSLQRKMKSYLTEKYQRERTTVGWDWESLWTQFVKDVTIPEQIVQLALIFMPEFRNFVAHPPALLPEMQPYQPPAVIQPKQQPSSVAAGGFEQQPPADQKQNPFENIKLVPSIAAHNPALVPGFGGIAGGLGQQPPVDQQGFGGIAGGLGQQPPVGQKGSGGIARGASTIATAAPFMPKTPAALKGLPPKTPVATEIILLDQAQLTPPPEGMSTQKWREHQALTARKEKKAAEEKLKEQEKAADEKLKEDQHKHEKELLQKDLENHKQRLELEGKRADSMTTIATTAAGALGDHLGQVTEVAFSGSGGKDKATAYLQDLNADASSEQMLAATKSHGAGATGRGRGSSKKATNSTKSKTPSRKKAALKSGTSSSIHSAPKNDDVAPALHDFKPGDAIKVIGKTHKGKFGTVHEDVKPWKENVPVNLDNEDGTSSKTWLKHSNISKKD